MTKAKWLEDWRNIDKVVMQSSDVLLSDRKDVDHLVLRFLYVIAVAVWHLLEDKIKEKT